MLILKPPYYNIEGIALFPDHANERQWYFAPSNPHITTLPDPVVGQDIPQLSLLRYRGEAGTGGFLNFDVNLGFPKEKLDKVRRKLMQLAGLQEEPMLAPVPLVDGSVKLIMLGKASDDVPPDADEPENNGIGFVENVSHAAKSSLYGENQAIFSVALDENGVQVMEDALLGEILPVGIIYSLEFHALRPAYNVNIKADWDRMQSHFSESHGVDSIYLQTEVDKTVDKLIEDQVIEITVDTFVPEDEDDVGFAGRRDRALNDFKDMVLETFFEPSLEPIDPDEEDDGTLNDLAKAHHRMVSTASSAGGLIPTFKSKEVDLTRIDKKSLNFNMTERTAVRRTIYPQAHLSGLFRLLRDADGNVELSRFVKDITLNDEWFKRRSVEARSLVDFANDNVDSINVTVKYDDRPKTIQLLAASSESGADNLSASWNSVLNASRMQRDVEYQYKVHFKGVNSAERPALLSSPNMVTVGDIFEVNPRGEELYFIDDIKIAARKNFPWAEYPDIEVHLRYKDEDAQINIQDSFILRSNTDEQTWKRFRTNKELTAYQMKLIFRGADNDDRTVDWQDYDVELFTIGNPRPNSLKVHVMPVVDWELVTNILVELKYEDRANDIIEQETLTFSTTKKEPQTQLFNLIDLDRRMVEYRVTFIYNNGAIQRVPVSRTMQETILVAPHMKGHRLIEVKTDPESFADRNITHIDVELAFSDEQAGLSSDDKIRFDANKSTGVFEFDYADKARNRYSAVVNIFHANGMMQTKTLDQLNDAQLTISID